MTNTPKKLLRNPVRRLNPSLAAFKTEQRTLDDNHPSTFVSLTLFITSTFNSPSASDCGIRVHEDGIYSEAHRSAKQEIREDGASGWESVKVDKKDDQDDNRYVEEATGVRIVVESLPMSRFGDRRFIDFIGFHCEIWKGWSSY